MPISLRKLGLGIVALAVLACAPAAGAGVGLGGLVDAVLQKGLDGQLPPHLSLVLGIGKGNSVAVKQAVLREGFRVRVFNVSVANHKDIVILHTNEQTRTTEAYLVSSAGKLRTAVSYEAGGQPQVMPPNQARAAVAAEIKFWTHLGRRGAPAR